MSKSINMFRGLIVAIALPLLGSPAFAADKKLVIGFAQAGSESGWRAANTESIQREAALRGITLKYVNGQGQAANQIAALHSFIADKVDAIVLAPVVETGWDDVLNEVKAAGIPVIIMDRALRTTGEEELYTAFLGSDFAEEGHMAAEWMIKNAGSRTKIVELQGTPGSSAAQGRRRAFIEAVAKLQRFKIIDTQVADFRQDKGKERMIEMLKKHGKTIDIVYAHNDDMAFGAMEAIEEAGLKPGKDIMIVSFDAIKPALQAIVDGRMNCTVECNPLFGPIVFDTVQKVLHGEKVRRTTFNKDQVIDTTNAAALLPTRQY